MESKGVKGLRCAVTGGSGFVGRRLVEMLIERGAEHVTSIDIRDPVTFENPDMNYLNDEQEKRVTYIKGDLGDLDCLVKAFKDCDCVWHIAALVGPYYPQELYKKVNYEGTLNVIKACKINKVPKLISSSSPSTRFTGHSISGKSTDDLPIPAPGHFTAPYAETKAMGEIAVRRACCAELLTINVAPHQVYGPRDSLFLPNFLAAAHSGQLRVIGNGENLVSMCHVDNYCHGLIIAIDALYVDSPALGRFYLVTDGNKPCNLWRLLDSAVVGMGYKSLFDKFMVPALLMYIIAYFLVVVGWILGTQFRISPFTVCMLTIDRYFDISVTERDLKYQPVVKYEDGWKQTLDWFAKHEKWWKAMASTMGQASLAKKKN